jgi:uncharacterized protein involved in exopolysaccharide biosynthesis
MSSLVEELPYGDSVDYGVLFARLAARRWWILGSVLLVAAAFAAVALVMRPVYRAAVVLAPANTERGADMLAFASTPLAGLASGLGVGPKDAATEEALAVLRSRQFTESFILSRNLIPRFFPRKWNAATQTWRVDEAHRPTVAQAYKYFDRKIRSIVQDKKTGLTTLQIDWNDRTEGADWANELVRLLNQEMRARAIAKADAAMRFLNEELRTTPTVEGRDAISRLLEAQTKERMVAHVTEDFSFRVVDKAISSDGEEPIRPQKAMLIAIGLVAGLAVGVVGVLLFGTSREPGVKHRMRNTP